MGLRTTPKASLPRAVVSTVVSFDCKMLMTTLLLVFYFLLVGLRSYSDFQVSQVWVVSLLL
jgi:uncharacterized membrane protein (DUF485 family)